jgi:D-alanyl-D-alanine carboxypeptidase (penicillin-binding protein 5/6)
LVSSAHKNGRHLIAVVLHSANRYQDTIKLLDYGFEAFDEVVVVTKGEHFTTIKVAEGTNKTVSVVAAESLSVLVPKGQSGSFEQKLSLVRLLSAPVKDQSKVGRLTVLVNDREIGGIDLITAQRIDRQPTPILLYEKLREQL